MPTAIVDVELTNAGWSSGWPAGGRRLAILRHRGRPVAEIALEPSPESIEPAAVEQALIETACWPVFSAWVDDVVGLDRSLREAPPATIAICTRDRPEMLSRCLDSLARLPGDGQEIVVVDSASRSPEPVRLAAERAGARLVRLETPGLDRARNSALASSSREIVAFVDDDATVEAGWLRALAAPFSDQRVAATTGLVLPACLDSPAQEWFERHFSFGRGYEVRRFRAGEPPLHQAWRCGVGASLAVRRATVLDELGGFDPTLDVGTRTHGGGDNDLFARLLAGGFEIEYRPDAVARHDHAAPVRGTTKKFFGYGVSWTAFLRRLDQHVGSSGMWGELARALLRQVGRLRAARGRPLRSVPARLLVAEAAGWIWGLVAVALSGRPTVPRARADCRSSGPLRSAPGSRHVESVYDLDLLPGIDSASLGLERASTSRAFVRLGVEPIGDLACADGANLSSASLRGALSGELAIGFLEAVAASGLLPRGCPTPPISPARLAAWFASLGEEAKFDPNGPFVERFLVPEERFRLRQLWFDRATRDIAVLEGWNRTLASELAEASRRFLGVQADLAKLEIERRELESKVVSQRTDSRSGEERISRDGGVP